MGLCLREIYHIESIYTYKMAECNFRASGAIKLKLIRPYPSEGCVCTGLLHGAPLESSMSCKTLVCGADFALYKLFSSIRVWSSTWCMPRFSSLAWASFSVGRGGKKMDKVRKQHYKRSNNINNTVQKALSKLNIAINPFFSRD